MEVLIIGAGPIGLAAAAWFSREGYRTNVIETLAADNSVEDVKAFNSRHQQIGLNPTSLHFLDELNDAIGGHVREAGCPQQDWINLPIYMLQDIIYREIKHSPKLQFYFQSRIKEIKTSQDQLVEIEVVTKENIVTFKPRLVVVADGRHNQSGEAYRWFNFPVAAGVSLSTYGVIGMIKREVTGNLCLRNYSRDNFITPYGPMHVRLLGSLQERYIALGTSVHSKILEELTSEQIRDLLMDTFQQLRDPIEPIPDEFSSYSTKPIEIVLDYRKETIKILSPTRTIISVEGDAARKTTFFSGSGLNSGYEALSILFKFCQENRELFQQTENNLQVDAKLLEKDLARLKITHQLLERGISYLLDDEITKEKSTRRSQPLVKSVSPTKVSIGDTIVIEGDGLVSLGYIPDILLEGKRSKMIKKQNISASYQYLKARLPKLVYGHYQVKLLYRGLTFNAGKIQVIQVKHPPEVETIAHDHNYYHIKGNNFTGPVELLIDGKERVRAFSESINSLRVSQSKLERANSLRVITPLGESDFHLLK